MKTPNKYRSANSPKLTLAQAIKIRDDYQFLEGEKDNSGGMTKTINRIVVGPYYSEKLNQFNAAYFKNGYDDRNDEEKLAASFSPDAYCVYVFYHDIRSVFLYGNLFEVLDDMGKDQIDFKKYGIK